jgi:magnesium chelatase family protein
VERYRARLSGPLMDRIDIHVRMPSVDFNDLRARTPGESSAALNFYLILSLLL